MSATDNNNRDNRVEYKENTVMDHEFDGIQEFDNRLPNWWLWLMWGSIVWALVYWLVFHTWGIGKLPHEEFDLVMAEAQKVELARMEAAGIDNEFFVALTESPDELATGRDVFVKYCVACHLDQGQGSVGPNLTDDYSINGCTPMEMFELVTDGKAANGMPPWGNQLGPSRVQAV
ncbi:MAG: cytochrome c oxidase cbb3-type subunit 3, partial [Candidatus Krumholzibacteriia bacterium]